MSPTDPPTWLAVLTLLGVLLARFEPAVEGFYLPGRARPRRNRWGWATPLPVPTTGRARVDFPRASRGRSDPPRLRFADGPERPGFAHGVDDPMLTDEERVRRAIADAGGQLRQQELLERSGWTKARMSRLLSAMAEAGTVVKIRVGRENVVCLADALPAILRGDDGSLEPNESVVVDDASDETAVVDGDAVRETARDGDDAGDAPDDE